MIPIAKTETFKLGKFTIVASPAPGSAHMQRFVVYHGARRLGTSMSRPTREFCQNLLTPPPPPPPAQWISYQYKPRGRPRKDAPPRRDPLLEDSDDMG